MPVPTDHFPSTHATWIDAQLTIAEGSHAPADAARQALRTHLMGRYYEALQAYVSTGSLVSLGEPAEIVGEFFARAVDAPEFLRRWRESGMPLRRWMMNAIAFHCRGAIRDRDRAAGRRAEIEDLDSVAATANDASRAFDRAWAVALAGEAFGIAQADADARSRPDDAAVFRMHAIDGLTHRQIAQQLGITEAQSAHAAKRVSDRMRQAVRDLLREEGVPAAGLEAAVAEVLALVEESADG